MWQSIPGVLEVLLAVLGILFLIGSLDDFIIDAVYTAKRLKPKLMNVLEWGVWAAKPEKSIAVLIPAWREDSVLESMVRTNLYRLQYENYRFFVGVYPNDIKTLEIAKSLEARYPQFLTVVVTDRPGPTTKAHCLNCIMKVLAESVEVARREGHGWIPHFIAIHDAEDVIHPKSFQAISAQENCDFIQVPIFSLPVSKKSWVAGTYLDEFAEIHMKEIPVREALGMPIPSAGVGTFIAWNFMDILRQRFGYWFDEDNLTEDYEISLRAARLGAKQRFLLVRDEKGEIVATREFFPDSLMRSIRQKTRWTTGISLQTWRKWKWLGLRPWIKGDLPIAYGLWRDRKALWSNPVTFTGWAVFFIATTAFVCRKGCFSASATHNWLALKIVLATNALLFALRVFQRIRFCAKVYGLPQGLLSAPRIAVSNVINAAASFQAIRQYSTASFAKSSSRIEWDKTDHKFPDIQITPQEIILKSNLSSERNT